MHVKKEHEEITRQYLMVRYIVFPRILLPSHYFLWKLMLTPLQPFPLNLKSLSHSWIEERERRLEHVRHECDRERRERERTLRDDFESDALREEEEIKRKSALSITVEMGKLKERLEKQHRVNTIFVHFSLPSFLTVHESFSLCTRRILWIDYPESICMKKSESLRMRGAGWYLITRRRRTRSCRN